MEDKPLLTYVEAVMMETQRFACVAVASLGHKALEEVRISGYRIPKGKKK